MDNVNDVNCKLYSFFILSIMYVALSIKYTTLHYTTVHLSNARHGAASYVVVEVQKMQKQSHFPLRIVRYVTARSLYFAEPK